MSTQPSLGRIDSMDQFRGFTVISMFVVNYVGPMAMIHPFWKHNQNYFSFADWIMPGFIFAVGFSYRLTVLKRLAKLGPWQTYWTYFRRSIALVVLSLMLYGWGDPFESYQDFSEGRQKGDSYSNEIEITNSAGEVEKVRVNPTLQFVMRLIKSNLWEVLAIIGVCQIFIMPVIARDSWVRFVAMIACLVGHVVISWWFNWAFVHGDQSNWMVQLWKTGSNRCWDGGFFGIMSWSVSMLAGSLIYDILANNSASRSVAGGKVFVFGAVFMIVGYLLSCGSRLYDVPVDGPVPDQYAASPVLPDFSNASGRSWTDLLAEPPFVMPPHPDQKRYNDLLARRDELAAKTERSEQEQEELDKLDTRLLGVVHYDYARPDNYWLMYKRIVSAPFILFTTGFSIALYALFIFLADLGGMTVGIFTTFGMNPLAAYVFHSIIKHSMREFLTPRDSPEWYVWMMTGIFIGLTYLFVRHLEKHNIYVRL